MSPEIYYDKMSRRRFKCVLATGNVCAPARNDGPRVTCLIGLLPTSTLCGYLISHLIAEYALRLVPQANKPV